MMLMMSRAINQSHIKVTTTCLLFATMWLWLRHRFTKDLFKLVALEWMLPVERDQAIQTVKQLVFNQVVFDLASVGARLDSTVAYNSLPPRHYTISLLFPFLYILQLLY